jgi:hypothetical protein
MTQGATKKFQRKKEDFTCGQCGFFVRGNGYTNHCPQCLWCRHVDVNPGDRAAECGGMMDPVGLEKKSGRYVIVHACTECGFRRKNASAPEDSIEALLALSRRQADALMK